MFPMDVFNPVSPYESAVLTRLGDIYKIFLGDEAYASFVDRGYYSKKHLDTNLRIVAINAVYCDILNFYMIVNPTNPGNSITWLENTLREAEKNNEVVYLLQHIPTMEKTYLSECGKRYHAILDRFSHIIRGHFNGHTHNDEIRIIHEYFGEKKPISVAFVAPALTTYNLFLIFLIPVSHFRILFLCNFHSAKNYIFLSNFLLPS